MESRSLMTKKREWPVDGDVNRWNPAQREYTSKELFYSYVTVTAIIPGAEIGFVIEIEEMSGVSVWWCLTTERNSWGHLKVKSG